MIIEEMAIIRGWSKKSPRLFMRRTMRIQGANKGNCCSCGECVPWRSVADRCWRCEIQDVRDRMPLFIDSDILTFLRNIGD